MGLTDSKTYTQYFSLESRITLICVQFFSRPYLFFANLNKFEFKTVIMKNDF
jgi:hypothetical protein